MAYIYNIIHVLANKQQQQSNIKFNAQFITKLYQRYHTITNVGSEITDELLLDVTPVPMIDNKTFQFNTQFTHKPTYKEIIRNWKDNISSMGEYNKSMIQNSTILNQNDFIELLANNKPTIIASNGSVYESSLD